MNRTIKLSNGNTVELTNSTRFFVPMYRKKYDTIFGFGIRSINSYDTSDWVECYIDFSNDMYRVSFDVEKEPRNYKIKLTAIDEAYGSETYYYSDFISLVERGYIRVKENEFQHVEKIRLITTITNSCAVIVTETTEVI